MNLRPQQAETGYVKFFKFYGLDLVRVQQQLQGDCPFNDCENPVNHFFASPGTGNWDCKRCGRKGNFYDFIRQFHEVCLMGTANDDYERLAMDRGISANTFKVHGFAYNYVTDEWLIPSYGLKRNLTNLYAWKQQATREGPVMTVMSGPCQKQLVYGVQHYHKDRSRPLWVLEGHWDLLAFYDAIVSEGKLDAHDFIAVPGATTFPDEDVSLLSMRDVRLVYDRDQAGEKGIYTAIQKMGRHNINPLSIQRVVWPKTLPEGYDVRDEYRRITSLVNGSRELLVTSLESKLEKMNVDVRKHANENYNPQARKLDCTSFESVIDSISRRLEMPPSLCDVFGILAGTVATTGVFDKPIWTYLIGESSAGKTTQVDLFSTTHEYCFGLTKLTGFLSGYFKEGMGDASLLPLFQDKCLIIKDMTPILRSAPNVQDNIFGELRDMYDGSIRAIYRNHMHRNFSGIRFNMIACVTDIIRTINNTDVGERFLCCEFDSYWDDQGYLETGTIDNDTMTRRASLNVLTKIGRGDNTADNLSEQRGHVWGFIDHVINRIKDDRKWVENIVGQTMEDDPYLRYIENLAKWTAAARSMVKRDKDKQLSFRPKVESHKRLVEQLTKVSTAMCFVFDESPQSTRVQSCVRKQALDTGYGFQQEIMLAICHSDLRQCMIPQLSRTLGLSPTSIINYTRDMQELGILTSHFPNQRGPGNQPHVFRLAPKYEEIAKTLGFFIPLPTNAELAASSQGEP